MKQFFDYMKKQDPFYKLFVYSVICVCGLCDIIVLVGMVYMVFQGGKEAFVGYLLFMLLMIGYLLQVGVLSDWAESKKIFSRSKNEE